MHSTHQCRLSQRQPVDEVHRLLYRYLRPVAADRFRPGVRGAEPVVGEGERAVVCQGSLVGGYSGVHGAVPVVNFTLEPGPQRGKR